MGSRVKGLLINVRIMMNKVENGRLIRVFVRLLWKMFCILLNCFKCMIWVLIGVEVVSGSGRCRKCWNVVLVMIVFRCVFR